MKGTPAKTSLRRRLLGIVVGGALGLLVDSVLVVVFGVAILYFVVFTLGFVVIVPVWIGIAWGIKWARRLPREPSWQVVVLLAAILWPAAVGGPFAIRIAQLRIAAWHDVPQYPRARNVSTTAELSSSEDFGDYVRIKFITEDAPAEVIGFYKNELSRRGWKPGPPHFIEWRMDGTPLWFTRSVPLSGFATILLGMQGSLHIKFGPASNQRGVQFQIIYGTHWDYGKTRSVSSDTWRRPGGRSNPSGAIGQAAQLGQPERPRSAAPPWRSEDCLRRLEWAAGRCGNATTGLSHDCLASKGLLRHTRLATTDRDYIRDVPENTVSAPNAAAINQMP